MTSRTAEFRALAERHGASPSRLSRADGSGAIATTGPRSAFFAHSLDVGRQIVRTTEKLERLSTLAARRGVFDNNTAEFQNLSFTIKQEISDLASALSNLEKDAKNTAAQANSKQKASAARAAMDMLKGKLAAAGKRFHDVVKRRSENEEKQSKRRQLFDSQVPSLSSGANLHFGTAGPSTDPSITLQQGSAGGFGGAGAGGMQMLAMAQPQAGEDIYLRDRADAVQAIESGLTEISQMYMKFNEILAEQRDMIVNIEDDVDQTIGHVDDASRNINDYYRAISSNRSLIMKIFAVIVVFIIFFVLFVL